MLLSSCEGVSAAADTLTRIPMSSGVGTCSGSGSGLGHMFTVGLRQPAPRGEGLAPSISARASIQRASYRIVGSIVHLHCSYISHSMW